MRLYPRPPILWPSALCSTPRCALTPSRGPPCAQRCCPPPVRRTITSSPDAPKEASTTHHRPPCYAPSSAASDVASATYAAVEALSSEPPEPGLRETIRLTVGEAGGPQRHRHLACPIPKPQVLARYLEQVL